MVLRRNDQRRSRTIGHAIRRSRRVHRCNSSPPSGREASRNMDLLPPSFWLICKYTWVRTQRKQKAYGTPGVVHSYCLQKVTWIATLELPDPSVNTTNTAVVEAIVSFQVCILLESSFAKIKLSSAWLICHFSYLHQFDDFSAHVNQQRNQSREINRSWPRMMVTLVGLDALSFSLIWSFGCSAMLHVLLTASSNESRQTSVAFAGACMGGSGLLEKGPRMHMSPKISTSSVLFCFLLISIIRVSH